MAESAKFTIGGREIDVPALSFLDIEELKETIQSLGPDLPWIDYSHKVLEIIAHQLEVPYRGLDRTRANGNLSTEEWLEIVRKTGLSFQCSGREAMALAVPMNELLRVSGFDFPEVQAAAESPGTGTSTSSSPNSPPTESSPETSTL